AHPVFVTGGVYGLQPTMLAFALGAGYRTKFDNVNFVPLWQSGQVATGTTSYNQAYSTTKDILGLAHAASVVTEDAFAGLTPPDGVAYNSTYNGHYQPQDWAYGASTTWWTSLGKSGVVFFQGRRVDSGKATLVSPTRGADFGNDAPDYVTSA